MAKGTKNISINELENEATTLSSKTPNTAPEKEEEGYIKTEKYVWGKPEVSAGSGARDESSVSGDTVAEDSESHA
jgi:hypothetical protein